MLNKNDKQFITSTISEAIVKNNTVLVKEMLSLFNATNERIDHVEEKLTKRIDEVEDRLSGRIDSVERKLGGRIDMVLDKLKEHYIILLDHGKRLGKLEDKVFAA